MTQIPPPERHHHGPIQSAAHKAYLCACMDHRFFERILAEIARAAGDLLTSDALNRVRQCSNPNCSWLFVDTSRAGRRRWCDMKVCGNRAKVYRFRELQNR